MPTQWSEAEQAPLGCIAPPRPQARPSKASLLALSFRASDRCHWRGNPFPRPPASLCEGGVKAEGFDGGRAVARPHPLHPSVGGDAHAVERSGTSTLGVHRPAAPPDAPHLIQTLSTFFQPNHRKIPYPLSSSFKVITGFFNLSGASHDPIFHQKNEIS